MTSTTVTTVAIRDGVHDVPWRLFGFSVALAATCAGELSGQVGWDLAAMLLFVAGLAAGWRHWLNRASGRVALLVAGASLAIGWALAPDPAVIVATAARMSSVIVLMLCVALLRPIFADRQLDAALAATLARFPAPLRPAIVVFASCAGALGLSFGAVGVAGATLGRRAVPEQAAACASMRGLVLSMLLAPSTASVAAVMATFPDLSWATTLAIGAPLALIGAVLAGFMAKPLIMEPIEHRRANVALAIGILLAEFAATLFAHLKLGLSVTLAISLASSVVALSCMLFWGRRDPPATLVRADEEIVERWTSIMPETALFLSCGMLVGVMQIPEVAAIAKSIAMAALPGGIWGIAAILFAVPLITVAGIHPMVPFAMLAPTISATSLGITDTGLYAVWIVTFMLSMLLTPISVLTMVTVTSFGIPARGLGLRGNGLYAAALAAASTVAIAVLCAANASN
jgi:hypothetical protein